MEDWRFISDLLSLVLEKLPSLSDYLHFSVVCKQWHEVAQRNKISRQVVLETSHAEPPLLLIPARVGSPQNHLFSIAKNKILDFQLSIPSNSRCCGSSHGCLFFNNETSFTMLNPFTGKNIQLPPIRFVVHLTGGDYCVRYVKKAILSCDPFANPNDYEVLVLHEAFSLAIFKAGDENWTFIKEPRTYCLDVIHHNGAFHVIGPHMGLYKIIIIAPPLGITVCGGGEIANMITIGTTKKAVLARSYKLDTIIPSYTRQYGEDKGNSGRRFYSKTYVLESSTGDLICAVRDFNTQLATTNFRMFKLVNDIQNNQHLKKKHWIEIDSLNGDALFLSDYASMAINVNSIPGYQKNNIYYIDKRGFEFKIKPHSSCDIGIFNLGNHAFGSHHVMDSFPVPMPRTTWIVPSLVVRDGESNKADLNPLR